MERFGIFLEELGSRLDGCWHTGDDPQRVMGLALYRRCFIMSGVLSSSRPSIERDLSIDSMLRVFSPNREQNCSNVGMVKESLIQTAFKISSAAWPLKHQVR